MKYHRVQFVVQIDVLGLTIPFIALPTPESITEEKRGDDLFPRRPVPH